MHWAVAEFSHSAGMDRIAEPHRAGDGKPFGTLTHEISVNSTWVIGSPMRAGGCCVSPGRSVMENAASLQALAQGLRTAVRVMDSQNPNRASLHEALLLTEQTLNESLSSQERAALLRVALKHLRDAD